MMKQNQRNQKKDNIPENRIFFYSAAFAIFALIITLMVVFLPKITDYMQKNNQGDSLLRNPKSVYTENAAGSSLLEGAIGHADYTLSIEKNPDAALYAVPANVPMCLTVSNPDMVQLQTVADALTVKNAVNQMPIAVSITENDAMGLSIIPKDGSWNKDTLYQITVEDETGTLPSFSAAFQTEHPFTVKSVYPGHETMYVPVNTGIEITFSDPIRNADFASFITVTPAISGQFELYPDGKTVVIVPDRVLETETQYALQIKEGLQADNGQMLSEGKLFCFVTEPALAQTSDKENPLYLNLKSDIIASPGETGAISYTTYLTDENAGNDIVEKEITYKVNIYAYASAEAAAAAMRENISQRKTDLYHSSVSPLLPTEALSLVWEGTPETYQNPDSLHSMWNQGYLYLPAMDSGTYLVEVTAVIETSNGTAQSTAQSFYQVTPLRAYTESANGETLIWVNRTDHQTNLPTQAEGAEITATLFKNTPWMTPAEASAQSSAAAFRSVTALTDERGLASFVSADTDAALLVLRHVDKTLILCVGTALPEEEPAPRYYIYTDRDVYFSNDTVHFFGFLGRRYQGQTLPDTLTLQVASAGAKITVAVDESGTFEGSFPIESWNNSYLSYTLSANDKPLIYDSVRVTQDEKPLYQLDVSFDKLFYTYEDAEANVTISASYFDNTPVSGLRIDLNTNIGTNVTLTTNTDGQASYSLPLHQPFHSQSTNAETIYVSANLIGYETTAASAQSCAAYFHSSGILEAERIDGYTSQVTLHKLDTSRLLTKADFTWEGGYPNNTRGAVLESTVSVTLKKTEYQKHVTGTSYDPISKTFYETYTWDTVETNEKSYTAKTENGIVKLDHLDAADFNGYYQYEIKWCDSVTKNQYTCTVYANQGFFWDYDDQAADTYALLPSASAAEIGETVSAVLHMGNKTVVLQTDAVLFTQYIGMHRRIAEQVVFGAGEHAGYQFTFGEDCTNGTVLFATVFDGKKYIQVPQQYISYDYQAQNNASLSIKTDQSNYRPGDTAKVFLDAGKNLAESTVLVSMVDEACFALGENTTFPLNEYFSEYAASFSDRIGWYQPWILRDARYDLRALLTEKTESSLYDVPCVDAVSEAVNENRMTATGSNTTVRKDFADLAAFTRVTLDENGHAELSLKVPDNITTWRITAIGALGVGAAADNQNNTASVRIGMAVSDTVCTLPFFLNVIMPELFTGGDEISCSVRCAGTGIKDTQNKNQNVSYRAVLLDETYQAVSTKECSAKASETAWFTFDALQDGEYFIEVTGSLANTETDAVRIPFCVVQTTQVIPYTETVSLDEISEINPAAFPLTLTFRDNTDAVYYKTQLRLRFGETSRTESLAAQYAAMYIEETVFGYCPAWYSTGTSMETIAANLNQYSGFLPINPYGEGDPYLTAKILYSIPNIFNAQKKAELLSLYQQILEDRTSDALDICTALLALASMGEPVLDQLYEAASYFGDAPTDAKLFLAAAFAAAGDSNTAKTVFQYVTDALGRTMNDNSYCISDASTEEAIHLTALGLLAASKIAPETAYQMVRYMDNHTSAFQLYTVELAAFVMYYTPVTADRETASFVFSLGTSDLVSISLRRGQTYTITLTKSDFQTFSILSSDSGIVADAAYGAAPNDVFHNGTSEETLHIEKKIEPYDVKNGIYQVVLSFSGMTDMDCLSFSFTDTIPSGARYVGAAMNGYDNNCSVWMNENQGQQLYGNLYVYCKRSQAKFPEGAQAYTFEGSCSYLIRGAVKGTFTAEPAVAVSFGTQTYALSDAYTITIRDNQWRIASLQTTAPTE